MPCHDETDNYWRVQASPDDPCTDLPTTTSQARCACPEGHPLTAHLQRANEKLVSWLKLLAELDMSGDAPIGWPETGTGRFLLQTIFFGHLDNLWPGHARTHCIVTVLDYKVYKCTGATQASREKHNIFCINFNKCHNYF